MYWIVFFDVRALGLPRLRWTSTPLLSMAREPQCHRCVDFSLSADEHRLLTFCMHVQSR